MKNDDELSFSYFFPYFRTASAVRFFYAKKKSRPKGENRNFLCAFGTKSQNIEEGHNIRFAWRSYMRNIIISSARLCANLCAKKGEKRVHNLGTFVERYTRKPL